MATAALEVERILRVDHAGERGAINIYRAQITVSRLLWPDCVDTLTAMLAHEQKHYAVFDREIRARRLRSCHALPLWALGGLVLGLLTALLGRRAIWSCTAAVEDTVCRHLQEQIAFLRRHDTAALQAVLSIEADEREHLDHALASGGAVSGLNRLIWWLVSTATATAIWLSRRL